MKVFHDTYKNLGIQIIATGSSSFDLSNKIIEPMTGRAYEFTLLPLSIDEIKAEIKIDEKILYDLMLYGSYPKVVSASNKIEKELAIQQIATNYLYKDIFIFGAIKKPKILEDLLKLLANQIGQIVSINELSINLGVSRTLVYSYLKLLEQSFIIKIIYSFSNNSRNEVKKAFKVFFIDLGVRNAILDIKTPISERLDKGLILENLFLNEKIKDYTNETFPPKIMFWRTRSGLEIDFVEKDGSQIKATECKWKKQDVKFTTFLKKYNTASTEVFSFTDFLK